MTFAVDKILQILQSDIERKPLNILTWKIIYTMKLKRLVSLAIGSGVAIATVGASSAKAALIVNPTGDATTLGSTILGNGITATNFVYTGAAKASGTFTGGISAGIGIDQGIILTSGDAKLAVGPNNSTGASGSNGVSGDAALTALGGFPTNDASVLKFDFTSTSSDLFFNFVFASEEYPEYVNSYNDVFGFFLDGKNIALLPGTTTPVSINNVNASKNSAYYVSNTPAIYNIQYDGFTTVLTAKASGLTAGNHTIKLAIADAVDSAFDSAVFLQANTFAATDPTLPALPPTGAGAGGAEVPEPFTIVGTLVGGTAALRMRKKLKSNDKV